MRVQILGGSGYIGSRLSSLLVAQGHEVTVVGRENPFLDARGAPGKVDFVKADVSDTNALLKISEAKPEAVVYCISLSQSESEKDIRRSIKSNVVGLWEFLESQKGNSECQRFIYLSTVQVYGACRHPLTEDSPAAPQNIYGLTHLYCEHLVRKYFNRCESISGVNLRLANGYGRPARLGLKCWQLVVNDLCKTAHSEGLVRLKSDGSPIRSFIHIDDICAAISLVLGLDASELEHDTFNVAGKDSQSMREIAETVAARYALRYGREIPIDIAGHIASATSKAPTLRRKSIYSTERIQRIGFSTAMTLSDGIDDLFEYLDEAV